MSDKRPAEGGEEPSPKRAAQPCPSPPACAWGSAAPNALAAAGGGGGCSWGTGGVSFSSISACAGGFGGGGGNGGGFAAVANHGSGFGAPDRGGSAFGSASPEEGNFVSARRATPTFGGATSFGGATAVSAADSPAEAPTVPRIRSSPVPEPVQNCTGEEDEECIHKCRAKLFRLEVRMERRRVPVSVRTEDTVGAEESAKETEREGDQTENGAAEGATSGAEADEKATSETEAKAEDSSKQDESGGGSGSKAKVSQDEGDGDDDDDDDAADSAKPVEEYLGGEEVEVTKWAEKGVGQVRLLVPKQASSRGEDSHAYPRLVMRVEHVGRLILNQPLGPTTAPAERVSDTSIRLVVVSASSDDATPQIQSYLFRVKTPAEADMLVNHINSSMAPSAEIVTESS